MASEFRVDLIPERMLKEGQVFSGETKVVVVEGVDVVEEPALEGKGKMVFPGGDPVQLSGEPEVLAPKIRLEDPRASKPLQVTLETSWQNQIIGFRTEAVQKEKDERVARLVIAGDLTPVSGNASLGEDFVQEIPSEPSTWSKRV